MRAISAFLLLSTCAFAQLAPITATFVSTDERFLPDGTSKVATSSKQFYRDATGRTRTESDGQAVIFDPAARTTIVLDLKAQVATIVSQPATAAGPSAAVAPATTTPDAGPSASGHPASTQKLIQPLGQQNIGDVPTTGFRAEVVMPPGVGNIQPLRLTSELWRSDSLQIPVKISTTESDILMSGDRIKRRRTQSYVNITTPSALDPLLFAVPPGFQVKNSSSGQ